MKLHNINTIPDNGSAYPSKAIRLSKRWASRRESQGFKGWFAACCRSTHKWITRVQIDQNRPDIRFLFLIGTMRSGSTLLSQILCSHRRIVGYGETHIQYESDENFVELITRSMWYRHLWRLSPRYFFDKILHVELIEDISLLSQMPIDWIVLRRNGEDCVKSMVRTFGMAPEHAAAYFKRQWLAIENWTAELTGQENINIITIEYEELVNNPEETLLRISKDLKLRPPLSEKYKVQRGVQRLGAGDPSGQIERGIIARIKHKEETIIPGEILAELSKVDEQSKRIIDSINNKFGATNHIPGNNRGGINDH